MKTEVITVDLSSPINSIDDIIRAADIIKNGGLVVFPTETVYGLGGDGTNPNAARKIYSAKGRPGDNPLIIHIAHPEDAEKYAETSDVYFKLAERFMPGPLTVILKAKSSVPKETRGGLDTVAVRCPENKIARLLIEHSGVAIAAPSANLSGSPSPTNANHVIDDMMGRVDMIIDGGECEFGLESTIVKIDDDNSLTLLRPGKITVSELSEIADVKIASAVLDKLGENEVALSPGMKYRHYAPKAPLVLLNGDIQEQMRYIKTDGTSGIACISYTEDIESLKNEIPNMPVYDLGSRTDELTQAHRLFYILREADKCGYRKIYAPLPNRDGVGLALYNRMIRAAAHTIINLRR